MKNSKSKTPAPTNEKKPTVKKPLDITKAATQDSEILIHDMELGEYFLHIYILETANLSTDGNLNARINVKLLQDQKYTKVMKGLGPSSKTFWGEHVFFQKKFDSRDELENASFEITVYDHSSMLKNDKIGSTSNLLLNIYGQKDHCLLEKWAILTNPEKNFLLPMGFIKFSVCFDQVSQRHPNLELLSHSSSTFDLLAIPPEISLQSKQLMIKVFRGKNIVPMDLDGTADPFVKFNLGGTVIKTAIKKSTLNPIFYQKLYIPLLYPTVFDKMEMTFMDYDLIGKNETIGSSFYLLSEIIKGTYTRPHWIYFYGGHDKCIDSDFSEKMNKNSELGSRIKGSLLLALEIVDSDEPKFTVEEMTIDESLEEKVIRTIEFTARIDADYVENIKCEASDLKICFKWGSDKGIFSEAVPNKRGALIFCKSFTLKESFEVSEKMDIFEQLPDLIISIASGDLHISYIRLKPREFVVSDSQPFYELTKLLSADLAVAETPEDKAGIIKFRVGVEKSQNLEFQMPKWPQVSLKPYFEKVYLVIHLIRAKDLLPADPTSTSDPIAQLYHLGSTAKSSLFPETLNPSWSEKIVMQSFLINGDIAPLVVNVSDRDENFVGSISYDFLGSAFVPLTKSNFARTKAQISDIKSTWHDLSIGKNHHLGKILLGVAIVREEFFSFLASEKLINKTSTVTLPILFTKTKHHIKINILGLRNLQSNGILPVKSVSIKINTSSLKQTNQIQKGSAFSNLTAVSKSGGANPSIGTVLSLTVELPDDLIFIPTLSCQVLENTLSFLREDSLIGTFQIELATHAYLSKITMIEKLKFIQRYRQDLKKKDKQNIEIHKDILNKINGIIKHLEAGINLNQSYIREEERDIFLKGENIKENIGALNASSLINFNDKISDTKAESDTQEIKETKDKQKPNLPQTVFAEGEIVSSYIQETNTIDDEGLRLLSQPRITLDSKSQKLLAQKFNDILPQDKIIIVPDSKNSSWVPPNPKFYMALGYKSKKTDNRHYRFFLEIPLEESFYMGEDFYTAIDIFRGKKPSFEKKDILARLFSILEENYRKTGTFKGNVEIIQEEVLNQIIALNLSDKELNALEIPKSITEWKFSKLDRDMLKGTKVTVTLYVISAEFYTSEDFDSENDSFLKVSFSGKTIQDSKVIDNQNNPKFYKRFVFEGAFPGPSDLTIDFLDKDDFNPDDLIGSIVIDVERRFFDRRWRNFAQKPIETRKIYHPNSESPVGNALLWVDIDPLSKKSRQEWSIDPRPLTNLELRIIVWELYNMPILDFEGTSDLFIIVNLPNFDLLQKTDVHMSAQNGFASFNWRTIFKVKIDENSRPEHFRANFRVYDKDLLSADDFAADATLDFSGLVQHVLENENRFFMTGKSRKGANGAKEFMVPLVLLKEPANPRERKKRPYIVVSVDLLAESIAVGSPAGIGRADPNQDPYLPPPKGRFAFSLNPMAMLEQIIGPAFMENIWGICVILVVVLIVLIFVPTFIAVLVSMIIVKKIDP